MEKETYKLKRMINDCNIANAFHDCRECKYRYTCQVKMEYIRRMKNDNSNIQKSKNG